MPGAKDDEFPATKGRGAGTPDDIPWGSLSSLFSRGKRENSGNEVGLKNCNTPALEPNKYKERQEIISV